MGDILGDHIAHQNCEKPLARSLSGEAQYLCVRLRFGLEVKKYVLASLYLLNFHRDLFRCQGSFGIGYRDMEFATTNTHIIRMGEHYYPLCLQGSVRGWSDAVLSPRKKKHA